MKYFLCVVSLVIFCAFSNAQDSTYVDDDYNTVFSEDVNITGFGGPLLNFSRVTDNFAFFMGGGGAILFNDNLYFGGYGSGMTNRIEIDSAVYSGNFIGFANGGLWAGYVFNGNKVIHPSFSLMLGWGSVTIANEFGYIKELDPVYVITPGLGFEINVSDFLRIDAGINYRYVTGINELSFEDEEFSDFGAHITLKIGWFKEMPEYPDEDEDFDE